MSHLKKGKKQLSTIIIHISWGESCGTVGPAHTVDVFMTFHLTKPSDGDRAAGLR